MLAAEDEFSAVAIAKTVAKDATNSGVIIFMKKTPLCVICGWIVYDSTGKPSRLIIFSALVVGHGPERRQ